MSNTDILRKGLEDLGIDVTDKMLKDLKIYRDILVEWNQKMNLNELPLNTVGIIDELKY